MEVKPWFWASFADGDLPKGSQFLGVIISRAADSLELAKYAWAAGINPGGELLGYAFPPYVEIPPQWTDRLLTREEAMAVNEWLTKRYQQ